MEAALPEVGSGMSPGAGGDSELAAVVEMGPGLQQEQGQLGLDSWARRWGEGGSHSRVRRYDKPIAQEQSTCEDRAV